MRSPHLLVGTRKHLKKIRVNYYKMQMLLPKFKECLEAFCLDALGIFKTAHVYENLFQLFKSRFLPIQREK